MRIETFVAIFEEEGFRPKIDDDAMVFKFELNTYFLDLQPDDEFYVRIVYPNFWPIESEEERSLAINEAMQLTKQVKVAKIFPVNDNMSVSAELFLPDEEAIRKIISRILTVLSGAVRLFAKNMIESKKHDAGV